ncbi:hypothetical protein [Flexivirga meconopsidis]|uniref:hypothetical protein n=1 Tax=Flexivirga meconopsidis TaxID=2977121 RepID=UPI00223F8E02|nr:hypothetical protein [Flexivirga meconopsidis]
MNKHTRETLDKIVGSPAPRNLEWPKFVTLWEDLADEVDNESGDRLAVKLNGHRVVFHRPHDGVVSIEDVEQARHLLRDHPDVHGTGDLLVVTIDEKEARILDFNLDTTGTSDTERDVRDTQSAGRHLRTVERHTGREDEQDLGRFFDQLGAELEGLTRDHRFVVFGHGRGKADAAAQFVDRLRKKHPPVAKQLAGVGSIDLSAASDTDLEQAALTLLNSGAR